MLYKQFEFHKHNISMLKKDICKRFIFSFLFISLISLTIFNLVKKQNSNSISSVFVALSILILVLSLLLVVLNFFYIVKDFICFKNLNSNKPAFISLFFNFRSKKHDFSKVFEAIVNVIYTLMALLLIGLLTYNVLNFFYLEKFATITPYLLFVAILGFNIGYEIKYELSIYNELPPRVEG